MTYIDGKTANKHINQMPSITGLTVLKYLTTQLYSLSCSVAHGVPQSSLKTGIDPRRYKDRAFWAALGHHFSWGSEHTKAGAALRDSGLNPGQVQEWQCLPELNTPRTHSLCRLTGMKHLLSAKVYFLLLSHSQLD